MRPAISTVKLSDTLTLSQRHRYYDTPAGYWLGDTMLGMNLSMGAPTEIAALTEALVSYQKRYAELDALYKALETKVRTCIRQFTVENNGDNDYEYE